MLKIKLYSLIYLYNTTKPAKVETINSTLLQIIKKDIYFFSTQGKEKLIFANSLVFLNYLKTLFKLNNIPFQRIKTHANLFLVSLNSLNELGHYLSLMASLKKYPFFFLFPFIFKTYKISLLNLNLFYHHKLTVFTSKITDLIIALIGTLKSYYFDHLSFFFNIKLIFFSKFLLLYKNCQQFVKA